MAGIKGGPRNPDLCRAEASHQRARPAAIDRRQHAHFALANSTPVVHDEAGKGGIQVALDYRPDEIANPLAQRCFDRIKPVVK
ncbi:hypothetical protein NKH53_26830 [Mesorhizobium australicum]|uniref:hypothetical protein n=1 Tax=Mesorhizobium australicum TaxID=536018 RepID=UPI0033393CCD